MKHLLYSIFFVLTLTVQAQIDRSQQPKPGPAPKINLVTPKSLKLSNGLNILVLENHKLPRVTYSLTIDNPPVYEGDKAGVSSLVSQMLGKGSKNITKDKFYKEVDYIGANLNLGIDGGYAAGLSKYSAKILELFADAALHPNFTQEEFDAEKTKLQESLKNQEKNVSSIASTVGSALAYGINHPKGEIITNETVNNITLEDIQRFYDNYFVPANAYLVIVGDVNFKEVEKLVKSNFNSWKKATPPSVSYAEPKDPATIEIDFIDMPNAVQSEILVGNLVNLKMNDPDYFAAALANYILGGGSEGKLFQNLREDKGYTYGAYSSIGSSKYPPSRFVASASVRNEVTDSAVVAFLDEISKFKNTPVTEEELALAKAKYSGSFVMSLESPSTQAEMALKIKIQDLPDNYYKNYLSRIEAVTIKDIQDATKKYLNLENTRIVVAGKGSEVLEGLKNISFNGKKIPVYYFDKEGGQVSEPDYKNAIPEGVSAESVIDNYFAAIGGKEKVNAVKSLFLAYEGSFNGATLRAEEKKTADKYAQSTSMNGNIMMGMISKGGEMYMKQGGNKIPLPPQVSADMQNTIGIFPEQAMLKNGNAKLTGIEKVEGKDAYKLEIPGETVKMTFYYDTESGLKVKEATQINIGGQTQNQEAFIKGYKEVDGIKFPLIKAATIGGQLIESELVDAKINPEFSEEDFQ